MGVLNKAKQLVCYFLGGVSSCKVGVKSKPHAAGCPATMQGVVVALPRSFVQTCMGTTQPQCTTNSLGPECHKMSNKQPTNNRLHQHVFFQCEEQTCQQIEMPHLLPEKNHQGHGFSGDLLTQAMQGMSPNMDPKEQGCW